LRAQAKQFNVRTWIAASPSQVPHYD
jgi:hypothetical protein